MTEHIPILELEMGPDEHRDIQGINQIPGEQAVVIDQWIIDDLAWSGLTPESFQVEALKGEDELWDRLGFTSIGGTPIMKIGGYWICYPEGGYRLKLKNPIIDKEGKKGVKYLSPSGKGNKAYILRKVGDVLENGPSDVPIFICEGEKKSAKATIEGFPCLGLSGVWCFKDSKNDFLPELEKYDWVKRRVYIVFDSDVVENPMVRYAEHSLAIELSNRGAEVYIVRLPGEPDGQKNGLDDFLVRHGAENFRKLVDKARPAPESYKEAETAPAPRLEVEHPNSLDGAAMHGLAGEIVKAIEPHSEADPAALLMNLLTSFGNAIGRTAHFKVGETEHFCNLFVLAVGDTSKARKGTSLNPILKRFETIDPDWTDNRIQSGLSSGEGLIAHVRDEIFKEDKVVDEGVSDKRLLLIEEEFARTLKAMNRDASTLSPVLRNAWDSKKLQTITKNSPIKATGAHISVIAHVTRQELLRLLNDTEVSNGLANRFLFLCVRRSKSLPFGGNFDPAVFQPLEDKLRKAVDFAKTAGAIKWAEATKRLWASVYPDLSDGKPGIIGAVTARAEAQVTRLACLYALLDCSAEIEPAHLRAALAIWSYAEDSVKYIFQDTARDPLANKVLKILSSRPCGIGRREISNELGRHYSSDRISEALDTLKASGFANNKKVDTGGRPSEQWFLIQNNDEQSE